jgi:hypothetical protein
MRIPKIFETVWLDDRRFDGRKVADIDPDTVKDLMKTRGAVIFSGFATPLAEFEKLYSTVRR